MYGNRFGYDPYGYNRYGYVPYDFFIFEHPLYALVIALIVVGIFTLFQKSYTLGQGLLGAGVVGLLSLIAWDYFDPLTSAEEKEAKKLKEEQDFEKMKENLAEIDKLKQ